MSKNKNIDYRKELLLTPHFKDTLKEYYNIINKESNTIDSPALLTFDDIPKSKIQYTHHFACKSGLHVGQRKLFLSEMQFLTNFFIKNPDQLKKTVYVVYAGSAPGHHTYLLSSFFPNVVFILVDPNKFELRVDLYFDSNTYWYSETGLLYKYLKSKYNNKIQNIDKENWLDTILKSKQKIFIIEDYYTDEMSDIFKKLNPIFWSDIRTNEIENEAPTDLDLLWNSAQQLNWIAKIEPVAYMLKFRVPFYIQRELLPSEYRATTFKMAKDLGINFISDYEKREFKYLDGKIFLQAFPGTASSESRLCKFDCKKNNKFILKFKDFDVKDYEDKFFYYNIFARTILHHENLYANKRLGFDHCNDCAIESKIWQNYNKYINNINIALCVETLGLFVNRGLRMQYHGNFYHPNIENINRITNYIHIEKKYITPTFNENYTIKSAKDLIYTNEFIINMLEKNDRSETLNYKSLIKKSINKNKDVYRSLLQIDPIDLRIIKKNNFENSYYDYNLRKLIMLMQYIEKIKNQNNQVVFICWDTKNLDIFNLIKKMYNIKFIIINKYSAKDYMDDNLIILNDYRKYKKSMFKDYEIHLYFEKLKSNDLCKELEDVFDMLDNIIKLINPKSTLCRMPFITYLNNCDLTKNNSALLTDVGNSDFAIISRPFYKINDILIAPYDYYTSYTLYFYITDYKKIKNSFIKYFERYNHFNIFKRVFSYYDNPNANKYIGFDCCHDCALTNKVITEYCNNNNISFENVFKKIIKLLKVDFKTNNHGSLYEDSYKSNLYLQSFIKPNSLIPINLATIKYNK